MVFRQCRLFLVFSLLCALSLGAQFNLVKEYRGNSFTSSDDWQYFGAADNLNNGDQNWVTQSQAVSEQLVTVNGAGNVIIKVDNTSNVLFENKRDTVRITSTAAYNLGTVWVFDVVHLPWGCSVWPALWTKGVNWPADGEIDIIENANAAMLNQIALHTNAGCTHTTPSTQLGKSLSSNCNSTDNSGCIVQDTANSDSYGPNFNQNGGGVYATQFDASGVFVWFWNRKNIPQSIQSLSSSKMLDISDWGNPVASYPSSSCEMATFFGPQQLVIDITLCGDFAGNGAVYNQTCANEPPNIPRSPAQIGPLCYQDNVIGPGSPRYDQAYFEISSIRAFSAGNTSTISSAGGAAPTAGSNSSTATGSHGGNSAVSVSCGHSMVPIIVFSSFLSLVSWIF